MRGQGLVVSERNKAGSRLRDLGVDHWESIKSIGKEGHHVAITIPMELKEPILWRLEKMNINEANLFPDLPGLAMSIETPLRCTGFTKKTIE